MPLAERGVEATTQWVHSLCCPTKISQVVLQCISVNGSSLLLQMSRAMFTRGQATGRRMPLQAMSTWRGRGAENLGKAHIREKNLLRLLVLSADRVRFERGFAQLSRVIYAHEFK
jgi:hypothetical protein